MSRLPTTRSHLSLVSPRAASGRLVLAGVAGTAQFVRRERDHARVASLSFCAGAAARACHIDVASALCEALRTVANDCGYRLEASRFVTEIWRAVPRAVEMRLEAWIDRVTDEHVVARARLLGADGEPFAIAGGAFRLAEQRGVVVIPGVNSRPVAADDATNGGGE